MPFGRDENFGWLGRVLTAPLATLLLIQISSGMFWRRSSASSSGSSTARMPWPIRSAPIRRIAEAGVPIVLSTDDPAIFETNISEEYAKAEQLGFSQPELLELAANGFRYALHPKFRTQE